MFIKCVSSVFQVYFQVGFKLVSGGFQVCFQCVSSVFQEFFKCVSSVFRSVIKCVFKCVFNCVSVLQVCLKCFSSVCFMFV